MMSQPFLKYSQILTQIKKAEIRPVYIFLGEEHYLKVELIEEIKKQIMKSDFSMDFNFNHLYGSQVDTETLSQIANTLPVFSEKRMIVVDEFERLKSLEKLNSYLENPMGNTCLILNSLEKDLPASLVYSSKDCSVAIFYPLWEKQLNQWIINDARDNEKIIRPDAVERLMDYCDNSLLEIKQELEKLYLYTAGRNQITSEDIQNLTGDNKKFSIFTLTDALGQKDFKVVIRIYRRMKSMGEKDIVIFASLNNFFHSLWKILYYKEMKIHDDEILKKMSMNPVRFKKLLPALSHFSYSSIRCIIDYLFQYDMKLKTLYMVHKHKHILMEEMLYRICFS
ncbi:MAG: DNA polymerase III subunit delta [Spirochaetes bacterium]|nr:DNA polymerase III subunit delta [Spirochaetota bacterium]